jgi:hypothetical protein
VPLVSTEMMAAVARLDCLDHLAPQGHQAHLENQDLMELQAKKVRQEQQVNMVKMVLLDFLEHQAQMVRKERLACRVCLVPMEMQGRTVIVISRSRESFPIWRCRSPKSRLSSSSFKDVERTAIIPTHLPVKSGLSRSLRSITRRLNKKFACI